MMRGDRSLSSVEGKGGAIADRTLSFNQKRTNYNVLCPPLLLLNSALPL
jgi:hypothetical protein